MYGSVRPKFLKPGGDNFINITSSRETLVLPTTDLKQNTDADSQTSFVYNRYHHLPLDTQRQRLPIFQYRNHILYLLEKFQTLVLVGETGSGKSTQIPQYLYECGYCSDGHRVVVTQPRVVAAASLATRVAEERGEVCGEGSVGYAVSFDDRCCADTRIKYVTEGILLREMFSDPLLTQYCVVMLDEVHERSQLTDVLMGLLKKILKKRKNLKLIVSSATVDAEFLRDFFDLSKKTEKKERKTSTIISVQGRTHPVDVFYVEEPVADYIKATIDTVIKIHENQPFGDILAFLTGQDDVLSAQNILRDYAQENNKKNESRRHFDSRMNAADMTVIPLYGSLVAREQVKAFQVAGNNVRKVVLATNIAETSVTIPGITYVIDCGFHKIRYFDPQVRLDNLTLCPISKANAVQRMGRAGRVSRGKCFRLYTEEYYSNMSSSVPPEMQRSDLSAILLQLKALGIDNLLRFSFPSPPPAKSLLAGLEVLLALEAIDQNGQLTVPLGVTMAELPVKPTMAKVLCSAADFGCLEEILSIVAMLQVENVFLKENSGQKSIDCKISKRNNFSVAEGDLITYLNVYDAYTRTIKAAVQSRDPTQHKSVKEWCRRMFLNHHALRKVWEIRKSLEKLMKNKFKMVDAVFDGPDLGSAKMERILKCLTSGMFPRVCFLHYTGCYRTISENFVDLYISPDSCIYDAPQPQWLLFNNVASSNEKTYIRDLVVIQRSWLAELASHYYKDV